VNNFFSFEAVVGWVEKAARGLWNVFFSVELGFNRVYGDDT
jgi:hypothetical protein